MSAAGDVRAVYEGSDGEATKALYLRLGAMGAAGAIALNLFRAQKASERAKVYRGGNSRGRFRAQAYEKKEWSLANLATELAISAEACGIVWGWGIDTKQEHHRHVLYVELPSGQVSFHLGHRGTGPDYPGQWDGMRGRRPARVVLFVASVLVGAVGAGDYRDTFTPVAAIGGKQETLL